MRLSRLKKLSVSSCLKPLSSFKFLTIETLFFLGKPQREYQHVLFYFFPSVDPFHQCSWNTYAADTKALRHQSLQCRQQKQVSSLCEPEFDCQEWLHHHDAAFIHVPVVLGNPYLCGHWALPNKSASLFIECLLWPKSSILMHYDL